MVKKADGAKSQPTPRAPVKAAVLRWAIDRSGIEPEDFYGRFPKLAEWETGEVHPTLKQLQDFASATRTPIGFLVLPEPPVLSVPIPDFRTMGNERLDSPSPDLLDTIYICQQRQEWYRDYARASNEQPLPFVGSVSLKTSITDAAAAMRETLGFNLESRRRASTWTEALRVFIEQTDHAGVLVMINGVVGSNNHRKLDPGEFRGFALADLFAPLVFINGSDTKSAQMFTLAHELAHLWLGQSALSDAGPAANLSHAVEVWCNKVAAEFLVPLQTIKASHEPDRELTEELNRLARHFKVSTLVILRRIHDLGHLNREQFWQAYQDEVARITSISKGSGGDFYLTTLVRVGKRFTRALVASTLEGQTLYRDAFRMLGVNKLATFNELGRNSGVTHGLPA